MIYNDNSIELRFQKDAYGTIITKQVPDGVQVIGRISDGRFFFGSFDNGPESLEDTPTLKNLTLDQMAQIMNHIPDF